MLGCELWLRSDQRNYSMKLQGYAGHSQGICSQGSSSAFVRGSTWYQTGSWSVGVELSTQMYPATRTVCDQWKNMDTSAKQTSNNNSKQPMCVHDYTTVVQCSFNHENGQFWWKTKLWIMCYHKFRLLDYQKLHYLCRSRRHYYGRRWNFQVIVVQCRIT